MNNTINNGMQDIGSMSMGAMNTGSTNMDAAGSNGFGGPQKANINKKLIGLAAAVVILIVLVILIAGNAGGGADKKAADAAMTMLCQDGDKIDFDKMYPAEIAKMYNDYVKEAKKAGKDLSAIYDEIIICGVAELQGESVTEWVEDMVMEFADHMDVDLNKIKITKGYIVIFQDEDEDIGCALVAEIGGKYGIYAIEDAGLLF